jgi:Chaperone of endosialidase
MRLDSSGNLGLGVTPSAWGNGGNISMAGGRSISTTTGTINLGSNFYYDGTNFKYPSSDYATFYSQASGLHKWFTAPSGTAGSAITFTQAMTLDASGNFGVGTTSPTSTIHANGTIQARLGATGVQIYGDGGSGYVNSVGSYPLIFQVNSTERARIDSSGNFYIGGTSGSIGFGGGKGFLVQSTGQMSNAVTGSLTNLYHQRDTSGSYSQFWYGALGSAPSAVGSITTNGTSTAFNTSSDYRLKEDVQQMTNALEKVAQLKPVTYKWKADGSAGEGFIAHELAEVCPHAVTGEKDAVDEDGNPKYQGIDVSFLVGTLTAAIQELNAKIDAQAAEIAVLKAGK